MRSGSFGGPPGAARRFPGAGGMGGMGGVGSAGGVSDMGGAGGIAIWAAGKRKRGKLCAKAFPFLCFSG